MPLQYPPRTALEATARSRTLNIEAETTKLVEELKASALGQAKDLPTPEERLVRFVGLVGLAEARAAMAATLRRVEKHARGEAKPIEFLWDYFVAVINERPARLRYLYVLLYLWETSLRSLIDRTLTAAKGADWHLITRNYLTDASAKRVLAKHPSIAEPVPGAADDYRFKVGCPQGAAFLNELDLWVLHTILLESWEVFGPQMKGSRPSAMPYKPAQDLFDELYRTRFHVMHVQPLDNEPFLGATNGLRRALAMVGVNYDSALDRIKRREQQLQDSVLQQPGGFAVQRLASTPLRADK